MQGLGLLGQTWITGLFGKSKNWFSNLNYIQNVLTGQIAEVNAIGESAWNQAARANPKMLPLFKPQVADMEWRIKQIIVRKSYIPSNKSILLATGGN